MIREKAKQTIEAILGPEEELKLEFRVLNAVTFSLFLVAGLNVFADYFMDLGWAILNFTILVALVTLGMYLLSRKYRKFNLIRLAFLMEICLASSYYWWQAGGMTSAPIIILVAGFIPLPLLFRGWQLVVALCSVGFTFIGLMTVELLRPDIVYRYDNLPLKIWDMSITAMIFCVGFVLLILLVKSGYDRQRARLLSIQKTLRDTNDVLEIKNVDLEKSLNEIKVLKGILPLCAHCRKVRDTEGYWKQLEAYISEHSEAEFSHGICENCAQEHFPGVSLDKNES